MFVCKEPPPHRRRTIRKGRKLTLPLTGLTVVSFEQAVAAPFCSRHLGDLGARVIKVEHRVGGDFTRAYDDAVHGIASYFVWLNRNKESLTLDIKHPDAHEVLTRLLTHADVVIQNLAPGSAHRMGIAAADVVARFPRAISVDISGYGVGGPYDEKRAYDLLIQAEGGLCSITGLPGAPAKAGPPVADMGTGLYSLTSVLAALYARERTGVGAAISISMFDVISEFMGFALQYTRHTGEERQPNGMSTPMVAPYGGYPTSDGQTVVLGTTNDSEWQRLALQMLKRPDLAADPRFATNIARCAEREVIDEAISAWTRRRPLADIQSVADAAGIGNSRYNTVKDVIGHAQLEQRGRWQQVSSPVGPLPSLLAPPESEDWHQRLDAVPALGQHTDSILAELGYSSEDIARLRADAAV
jgi:itaconate CoA-transferase